MNEFINLADFLGLNQENFNEMGGKLETDAQNKQRALLDKVDFNNLIAKDQTTADTAEGAYAGSAAAKGLQDEAGQLGQYLEGLQTGSGATAGLQTQYTGGASAMDGLLAAMRVGQLGRAQSQNVADQAGELRRFGVSALRDAPDAMQMMDAPFGRAKANQLQLQQQQRQMGFQNAYTNPSPFAVNQKPSLGLNANIWKQTFGDRLKQGSDMQQAEIEKKKRQRLAVQNNVMTPGRGITPTNYVAQQQKTEAPIRAAAKRGGTTYAQESQRTPGSVNYGGFRKPKEWY